MTLYRRMARRFERALLGTVMSVIVFIIERRILKAIRGATAEPPHEGDFGPVRNGPAGQA